MKMDEWTNEVNNNNYEEEPIHTEPENTETYSSEPIDVDVHTDEPYADEPYTGGPYAGSAHVMVKHPKYVTRKAFVLTIIICMILSSALTAGAVVLLSETGVISSGKRVSATNYTLQQATGSEKSIQEIVAMNENAVVEIRTESTAYDMWLRNYVTEGAGSGVIIDTKGYIITNNHVVEGANKITVTLKDGSEYEAELVGTDPDNDVAVVKIKANNLTATTYGNSDDINVGDLAVAIGNPLGELGGTASQGIVSATDRKITLDNRELTLIQTDASINPGNSGGGLFNQYGQLVGIVVAKSAGSDIEGLGFAIPINTAAPIAKALIKGESVKASHPIIGINIVDIQDTETAMKYNVKILGVYVHSISSKEAEKAGFQEGDLIYYIEDQRIENSDELAAALAKHKAGDKVSVTVVRGNNTETLNVVLQENQ